MPSHSSTPAANGKPAPAAREPMPALDEAPIDAGASSGVQLPEQAARQKADLHHAQPLNRQAVERALPAHPDPDDPVAP